VAPALGKLTIGPMLAPPSLSHPLGTDDLGHDMLVLLAQGAQVSFVIGVLATLIALAVARCSACARHSADAWSTTS